MIITVCNAGLNLAVWITVNIRRVDNLRRERIKARNSTFNPGVIVLLPDVSLPKSASVCIAPIGMNPIARDVQRHLRRQTLSDAAARWQLVRSKTRTIAFHRRLGFLCSRRWLRYIFLSIAQRAPFATKHRWINDENGTKWRFESPSTRIVPEACHAASDDVIRCFFVRQSNTSLWLAETSRSHTVLWFWTHN